ncbi:MAG TPA: hypothetical protein PLZ05_01875 [Alphaproteobacteria bacterium]|nr:hypothetical protein [Alphaproteobacteria bacterium]
MFKKLKLKLAARKVEKRKESSTKEPKTGKTSAFWSKVKSIVSWPFRALKSVGNKIWHWLRFIDVIGMINLTLLVGIIVLFSILISNILNCGNDKDYVLVASEDVPVTITTTEVTTNKSNPMILRRTQTVKTRTVRATITLPLKKASCCKAENIHLVKAAKKEYNLYGDVIVDGTKPSEKLKCGTSIKGNLYLQNMRKYTLPCGLHIEGNLLLRNVEMLQFCGDFTITGNIYVSRNSSFGPIPKTARLGGQIIF